MHTPCRHYWYMKMRVGGCQLRSDLDMQTATLWFSSHPCIELGKGKGGGAGLADVADVQMKFNPLRWWKLQTSWGAYIM